MKPTRLLFLTGFLLLLTTRASAGADPTRTLIMMDTIGNTPFALQGDTQPEVSHNTRLSAITWPDVPSFLRNSPHWHQDTIPEFNPGVYHYTIQLPPTWNSIPALVPKPDDLNARVRCSSATRLEGHYVDRVIEDLKSWGVTNSQIDAGPLSITYFQEKNDAWFLLKIVNDSVTAGTKPAGDPEDYELVDMWGDYSGESMWYADGDSSEKHGGGYTRKPEFWQPDPEPGYDGSWGRTPEASEWTYHRNQDQLHPDIGRHAFDPIYAHRSTVLSYRYDVSKGFGTLQIIEAIPENTTVDSLMANIIRLHEGQALEVKGKSTGDTIAGDDTLVVTSAQFENITKYALKVGDPLSSKATLTAKSGSGYAIKEGVVSGIPWGTSIEAVLDNLTASPGASIYVKNDNGWLMPMQIRNMAGEYVKTTASNDIILKVVSENNQNVNTYQLMIRVSDDEAILISDVYQVNQEAKLLSMIPEGTNVRTLMGNITANAGASVLLEDKGGRHREAGLVEQDDRLVVTSPSGTVAKRYFINTLEENPGSECYVVSGMYYVNQVEKVISNVGYTDVSNFSEQVTPAPLADMVVVDSDSNVVTSGTVTSQHRVVVTSANQSKVVSYEVRVDKWYSTEDEAIPQISVYPNPAENELRVRGLKPGSKIIIRDITGRVVKIIPGWNLSQRTILLHELPAGIYLLTVQNGKVTSNTHPFVK